MREGDEATDKCSMDTTETVGQVLGGNPVTENCAYEAWNRLQPT